MTDFLLQIQIDNTGLQQIAAAGMSVALLQPQDQADYQIVALLTAATNTIDVSWSDAVSVYTSSYGLSAYANLQINSYMAAQPQQKFNFDGSIITQSGSTSLAETVQLINSSGSTVTSGLANVFEINGQSQDLAITSASSVLNTGQGSFQISNQIMLTLMSGVNVGEAVPSQVIPNFQTQRQKNRFVHQITVQPPLILNFSADNATQSVTFVDLINVFMSDTS